MKNAISNKKNTFPNTQATNKVVDKTTDTKSLQIEKILGKVPNNIPGTGVYTQDFFTSLTQQKEKHISIEKFVEMMSSIEGREEIITSIKENTINHEDILKILEKLHNKNEEPTFSFIEYLLMLSLKIDETFIDNSISTSKFIQLLPHDNISDILKNFQEKKATITQSNKLLEKFIYSYVVGKFHSYNKDPSSVDIIAVTKDLEEVQENFPHITIKKKILRNLCEEVLMTNGTVEKNISVFNALISDFKGKDSQWADTFLQMHCPMSIDISKIEDNKYNIGEKNYKVIGFDTYHIHQSNIEKNKYVHKLSPGHFLIIIENEEIKLEFNAIYRSSPKAREIERAAIKYASNPKKYTNEFKQILRTYYNKDSLGVKGGFDRFVNEGLKETRRLHKLKESLSLSEIDNELIESAKQDYLNASFNYIEDEEAPQNKQEKTEITNGKNITTTKKHASFLEHISIEEFVEMMKTREERDNFMEELLNSDSNYENIIDILNSLEKDSPEFYLCFIEYFIILILEKKEQKEENIKSIKKLYTFVKQAFNPSDIVSIREKLQKSPITKNKSLMLTFLCYFNVGKIIFDDNKFIEGDVSIDLVMKGVNPLLQNLLEENFSANLHFLEDIHRNCNIEILSRLQVPFSKIDTASIVGKEYLIDNYKFPIIGIENIKTIDEEIENSTYIVYKNGELCLEIQELENVMSIEQMKKAIKNPSLKDFVSESMEEMLGFDQSSLDEAIEDVAGFEEYITENSSELQDILRRYKTYLTDTYRGKQKKVEKTYVNLINDTKKYNSIRRTSRKRYIKAALNYENSATTLDTQDQQADSTAKITRILKEIPSNIRGKGVYTQDFFEKNIEEILRKTTTVTPEPQKVITEKQQDVNNILNTNLSQRTAKILQKNGIEIQLLNEEIWLSKEQSRIRSEKSDHNIEHTVEYDNKIENFLKNFKHKLKKHTNGKIIGYQTPSGKYILLHLEQNKSILISDVIGIMTYVTSPELQPADINDLENLKSVNNKLSFHGVVKKYTGDDERDTASWIDRLDNVIKNAENKKVLLVGGTRHKIRNTLLKLYRKNKIPDYAYISSSKFLEWVEAYNNELLSSVDDLPKKQAVSLVGENGDNITVQTAINKLGGETHFSHYKNSSSKAGEYLRCLLDGERESAKDMFECMRKNHTISGDIKSFLHSLQNSPLSLEDFSALFKQTGRTKIKARERLGVFHGLFTADSWIIGLGKNPNDTEKLGYKSKLEYLKALLRENKMLA